MDSLPKTAMGAVTPSSMSAPTHFIALLWLGKFLTAVGVYLAYDSLKAIHLVQFLFIAKLASTAFMLILQKPLSGRRLSVRQWLSVLRHSAAHVAIQLLWLLGLTLCGPLRSLLVFFQPDIVVITAIAICFGTGKPTPSKSRGVILMVIAVVTLTLLDVDNPMPVPDHPEGFPHTSSVTHAIFYIISLVGVSDHKGGLFLLILAVLCNVAVRSVGRRLAVDIGGGKRLYVISSLLSTLMLLPWAVYSFIVHPIRTEWTSLVVPLALISTILFVLDFYIETYASSKVSELSAGRAIHLAVISSALLLAAVWTHPFTVQLSQTVSPVGMATEDHALTTGVWVSAALLATASFVLTAPNPRGSRGSFVGYTPEGQPLFVFAERTLRDTGQSLMAFARHTLRQILEERDSRWIFYFLCINLAFTFVELLYGTLTNSLGLISDGFHMLFDCTALVMGLVAAVISRWPPSQLFPYGYGRIEVLSGFINGLFLTVVALVVFVESIDRFVDPPEVSTDKLLAVSVAGLLVNLIGILAFQSSHGHSHGGGGSHGHSHGDSTNMRGVFLHVLADTLGSVGVIISSLLIQYFGWLIADPVCSIFIAIMIFLSVIPLLKESVSILMLRTPIGCESQLQEGLSKLLTLEGVLSYSEQHFWQHSSSVLLGMIHVQVSPSANEQKVVQQVGSVFRDRGITNLVVQVEKESFFQHRTGLSASQNQISDIHNDLHKFKQFTFY